MEVLALTVSCRIIVGEILSIVGKFKCTLGEFIRILVMQKTIHA